MLFTGHFLAFSGKTHRGTIGHFPKSFVDKDFVACQTLKDLGFKFVADARSDMDFLSHFLTAIIFTS